MDAMTELAKMLKDRDNKPPSSMTTGTIISPPPNAKIRLNDVVVLENHHLVWAAHMLEGYIREIETDGIINNHTTKDTIKPGDEVILMPVADSQLYFVLDRAVRFE